MTFAVVFPGQGSQKTGMLAALADEHPVVKEVFTEASDHFGQDLWTLAQSGPDDALAETRVTQPLMFTSGVAVWRVLEAAGLGQPAAVAGHSLGEFVALVAANVLSFSDGCKLVKRRAGLMANAVPEGEGGMAALIGMDDQAVVSLCQDHTGERIVEAVNFNSPGQVAISGHLDAIEKAVAEAKPRGAKKAVVLPVSVPNHSSLMRGAGEELANSMDAVTFNENSIPLVQNASATAPASVQDLVASLKQHVYSPVQWTRTVEALRDTYGATTLIEAGPGKVLTGLTKRIDRGLPCLPIDSDETLTAALDALNKAGAEA